MRIFKGNPFNTLLEIEHDGEFFAYDYQIDSFQIDGEWLESDDSLKVFEEFGAELDQDWENETTTINFECGSRLVFSPNDIEFITRG